MQFLYPGFLFALATLAIPVIIHLFSFRRYKKIFFSNTRFLTDVQQEHRSRNRVRHWLLLALRMLALACLVLAFAHPFIPQKGTAFNPGKKYVSVYIDNSFSMSNTGSEGELLQVAKKKALEIASAYQEGDAYQLVTNDFELKHQRWVTRSEFQRFVQEVQSAPAFRTVTDVVTRMRENFRKAETSNRNAYFISDFQQNMADLSSLKNDSNIRMSFIPLAAAAQNNIYIDTAWFDAPLWQIGQKNTLKVRIVNTGDNEVKDRTLSLTINGKSKSLATYSISALGSTVVPIVYTITDDGVNKGVLSIDDYPISFDNTLYFSYPVTKTIPVLCINGASENTNITRAFAAEHSFALTNVNAGTVDYSSLNKYDFIILNELQNVSSGLGSVLKDFMTKRGNVLIVPPAADMNTASYNAFLQEMMANSYGSIVNSAAGIAPLDMHNPFFANIFDEMSGNTGMPVASKYYQLSKLSNTREAVLMKFTNDDAFLTAVPGGHGYMFLSAVPFTETWSSFPNHGLFLPFLYKMVFFHHFSDRLYYVIDQDNYLQVNSQADDKEKIFRLRKDSVEMIPPQRMLNGNLNLFVEGLIRSAGHYTLSNKETDEKPEVYAFNYSRKESEMKFLSDTEIKEQTAGIKAAVLDAGSISLSHTIKEAQAGTKIWKWFILAALLFLLGETLLTRFWK